MPAPPARSSIFPTGSLSPSTAKTLFADWYDYTVALLGASGSAADARTALGAADASIVSSDEDFGSSLALVSSGGGAVGGYTTKVGRGYRVGTRFFFNLTITLSSLGTLAAGDVSIQTLPHNSDPAAGSRTTGTCFASSLAAGITSPPQWDIVEGTSTLRLFKFAAGALTRLQVSDLTASSLIRITGFVELAP